MKILTLTEIIEPRLKKKKVGWEFGDMRKFKSDASIGHGHFSVVTLDDDPHFVNKRSFRVVDPKDTHDAYWGYVYYIIKNKLWQNPYFPRIYDVKRIVDKDGKMHFTAKMEKLHPFNPNDIEGTVLPLVRRMLTKEARLEFGNITGQDLLTLIESAVAGDDYLKYIKDDQLIDAIKKLQYYRNKHPTLIDIWSDNVMIRKSPYGPQLVFTDPFGFKE